jgi:hypothetical protein
MKIATSKLVSGVFNSLLTVQCCFSLGVLCLLMVLIHCRIEGGIPPLVELLESQDIKVQRAAAGALRTLAFKNDENKTLVRTETSLK